MSVLPFPGVPRLITERAPITSEGDYGFAKIVGDFYRGFGVFNGDYVIFDFSETVKNGDMAIVDFKNQEVLFLVYFVLDKVILFGEQIEIINREETIFVGRVVRLERDF